MGLIFYRKHSPSVFNNLPERNPSLGKQINLKQLWWFCRGQVEEAANERSVDLWPRIDGIQTCRRWAACSNICIHLESGFVVRLQVQSFRLRLVEFCFDFHQLFFFFCKKNDVLLSLCSRIIDALFCVVQGRQHSQFIPTFLLLITENNPDEERS